MPETSLPIWHESKWARRADLIAWAAVAVVVFRLSLEENLNWIAWVFVGGLAVFCTITQWPYGAVFVLIASSAMPLFFVEIFGWKARPEHIAAAVVGAAVLIWLASRKRRFPFSQLDCWVLAYVVINYISSLIGSPDPGSTLRWALQSNLAVFPYFMIRILVSEIELLRRSFRIFLGVALAESLYGILCYFSSQLFGTATGVSVGQYFGDVAASFGSMYEPNLFGAYTAACAVMFLALYLSSDRHRTGDLVGFLIGSIATILSFSRGALFSLIAVACFVLWRSPSQGKTYRSKAITFGLATGLALLVAVSTVGGVLRDRVTNLFAQGLADETTITRAIVLQQALQEVPSHLWLGSGTASFNLSFEWNRFVPEWSNDKTWIGNAPLRILHDTGLLGLSIIVGFLLSLWWKVRGELKRYQFGFPILLSLSAGILVYGITFQLTDGTILAFTWIHLGLLASAANLRNDPEAIVPGREPKRIGPIRTFGDAVENV